MTQGPNPAKAYSLPVIWANPSQALGKPDDLFADNTGGGYATIKLGDFGFSIPGGETIVGVEVVVTGRRSPTSGGGGE